MANSTISRLLDEYFSSVPVPALEQFLDEIAFMRADDEPVEIARRFLKNPVFDRKNIYDIEEMYIHLSKPGLRYMVPLILKAYFDEVWDMTDNIPYALIDEFRTWKVELEKPLRESVISSRCFWEGFSSDQLRLLTHSFEVIIDAWDAPS